MASLRTRLTQLWRRGTTATPSPTTPPTPPTPSQRHQRVQQQRSEERLTQGRPTQAQGRASYPGDFSGTPDLSYSPKPDGQPDPGEIVWTWVPYEEDHRQGKDRPVLLVGRDGSWLLALMLTSKDHDRDHAQEARHGRYWQDIGSGAWDGKGRASEVRVDRILRVDPAAVRREGAVLDRARFDEVAAAVRAAT